MILTDASGHRLSDYPGATLGKSDGRDDRSVGLLCSGSYNIGDGDDGCHDA
jgi:hypothetical protein